MSGKPEGRQAFPLEPRVQGRFARIFTAEDVLFRRPASCRPASFPALAFATLRANRQYGDVAVTTRYAVAMTTQPLFSP